jgi:hypothetical protein
MRRLRKWLALSPAEKRTFLEALRLLWMIRLALWILPFGMVRRFVSDYHPARATLPAKGDPALLTEAVMRAARLVPVGTCLTQALSTKVLLARRGLACEVRFGARKIQERFEAHAWVEMEGRAILGEPSPGEFSDFVR